MAMDDITKAGTYATDRNLCRLALPQQWVDTALNSAIWKDDLRPSEAIMMAANISAALERELRESGQVQTYCDARRAK